MTRVDSSGALARIVVTALLVGLFGVALFMATLPARQPGVGPSALSVERNGRRAAFLLLEQPFARGSLLEGKPEIWRSAPARLPSGRHLLVLPAAGVPTQDEDDPATTAGRLRDPLHYRRFLDRGGTILSGLDADQRGFFADGLGIASVAELEIEESGLARPRDTPELLLATGERLQPEARQWSVFADRPRTSEIETLAQDSFGDEVILSLRVGGGRLVLLADDSLFENTRIDDGDNALLFVRTLEMLSPFERVLFDEYVLGGWAPATPVSLALSKGPRVFTLHLVALAAVLLWLGFAPRPFPRDPAPRIQRTAIARAEGLAGMLEAAGRYPLLARLLREGQTRRMATRLGLGPTTDAEDTRERLLAAVQQRLDAEAQAALPSARALLQERSVGNAVQLEQLGLELSRMEAMVSTRGAGARAARRRESRVGAVTGQQALPTKKL